MNIAPRAQVVDDYADYSSWVDGASYLGLIALDEATFKKVYEKCQELIRQSNVTYEYISQTPSPLEDEITKGADMRFYSSDINRTTILFLKKDRCHIGVLSIGT